MAMAAPNQPLPGLQVTAPDEDMEISDYERNADDIDIDIDLTVDPSHHEDENMDDDRSEHDSKDDVMLDGDGNEEDGMMQDNMSVPDEHLTDASDVGYVDIEVKEAPQTQPAAEHVDVQVQDSSQAEDFIDYDDTAAVQAQLAPQAAQLSVDHSVTEQNQLPDSENSGNQETNVQVQSAEESTGPQLSAQDQTSASVEVAVEETTSANSCVEDPIAASSSAVQNAGESHVADNPVLAHSEATPVESVLDSHTVTVTEGGTDLPTEIGENQSQAQGSPHNGQNEKVDATPEVVEQQAEPEQSAQQSDEALDFSNLPFDSKHDADNESSHTAVSLHPVVVVYQGDEISLFPPHGSDTSDSFYFLQDESLANESIRALLQACRQVLGETMRDQDELEIDVAELGLCVSEESDNAASTSFSQILDVYLQLHQLDGHQNPGPLYMTLNTKTRFSARLNALLAAIADGRGMSQLSFLEDVTEEDAYVGSENGPEEHDPANHGDEQDGREHADNSISGNAPEHEASQEEASYGKSHTEGEQDPESDSTAVQRTQTRVENGVDAVSQEQGSTSQQNEESTSTHQYEPQDYVSPKPEDLPEYESSDEGNDPIAQGNANGVEEGSRVDASGPDYSRENDQINYDDGEIAEEARDDASIRSSTLQGDNTPAAVDDGVSHRESIASVVPTGASDAPQDESHGESREDIPETRKDEPSQRDGLDTQALESTAVTEENQRLEQPIGQDGLQNADETLEQELERELNGPPGSFHLPEGAQDMPDEEHYTANYEEGDEYGFEHDGDVQETQDGEGSYEEFVVVEAEDAHENSTAFDDGQAADYQEWSHGGGFDDAEAEQTAENDPDETHSELEQGLEDNHAGQAQPKAHASDEDELDTIDYDDEELSRPSSAQQDEAAAPSPSSAKRGWEELGQDDEDQANEQAPKKVKSE